MRGLSWWKRRRIDDIAEEIETHLALATRERIERGMSPEEARAAALREFGNVALIQQTTREVWSWTRVEQLLEDLRFGARILWHAPGLSATAVWLIAMVIGGNTTIYSIVNGMLVSPARGVHADRLVAIKHVQPGVPLADPFISFPNYLDYARLATTTQRLAGWSDERLTISTADGNYAVFGALVTTNYFDTFGVAMAHGRSLRAADDEARDGVVAVISDRLWRERFAQAPDVVGRVFNINSVPVTIVGIATAGFAGAMLNPNEDVWMPIRAFYRAVKSGDVLNNRAQPLVVMVGQRAPGASLQEVRAEFDALASQLSAAYPESFTTYGSRGVMPLTNARTRVSPYSAAALLPMADMAPRFLALFSIVTVLTLLIVSANVANLMLGRAVERQRDTAVRRSLGASRVRIVRMLLAEGAAIAMVAWAAACLFAWWTSRALMQIVEPTPGLLEEIKPDWTLAAYAMLLAAAATIAFTVAPSIRACRLQILPLLRSGEQAVAQGRSTVSNALVVLQLAFSVLLLTSAGLAYRSLSMLDSGNVGFDPEPLLLATVRTGPDVFGTAASNRSTLPEKLATLERVREHLAEQSRVEAVSYSRRIPGAYFLATTPVRRTDMNGAVQAFVRPVGPHYISALGLAPLAGRELTHVDTRGAAATAVINEQLARELFAGGPVIGQMLQITEQGTPVEIVGVAPNALFDGPVHDPHPRYVFTSLPQSTDANFTDMTFFVRYQGALEAITPTIGRAIAEVDAALPIVSMSTMASRLAGVTVMERQVTTLLITFSFTSLLVAALGQYAVAMFNMRRRTRDFGVRLALGASAERIQRGVIREAFTLAVPGLLIGFALSAAIATVFRAQLFGVTPVDPPTYTGVFVLLGLTSVVASYLPAWRASHVNVVDALRN